MSVGGGAPRTLPGRPTGRDLARWRKEQEKSLREHADALCLTEALIEQALAAVLLESDDLPDGAMVVRGGTSSSEHLLLNARTTLRRTGRPGVSVFASDALETAQLLHMANVPHPCITRTTAGEVRGAGFELEATGKPLHYTVWLPDAETLESSCARLASCFGIPERRHVLPQ